MKNNNIELKYNSRKGSVLVFTLLILFILLVSAIGIATVTVNERKMAGTTGKTTQAMYVANTGVEVTQERLLSAGSTDTLDTIYGVGNCIAGSVVLNPPPLGADKPITITFYTDDIGETKANCTDTPGDIKKIKSVGTYGGTSRAIKAAVPLCRSYTVNVGTDPAAVEFDSKTNSVWVANSSDGTVSQINVFNGTITRTVSVHATNLGARGMAFDSKTDSIWVGNLEDNKISQIDVGNGTITRTVSVEGPWAMVFDGNNSVWATNDTASGVDNIVQINVNDGIITRTVSVGGASDPRSIAFDSKTNSIWTARSGDYKVSQIDISSGMITRTIDVGHMPFGTYGVAFDSKTESIWVGNFAGSPGDYTVSQINVNSGDINKNIIISRTLTGIAFDSETNSIWTNSGDNKISQIDVGDGTITRVATVGQVPFGMTFDSKTKSIWVPNYNDDTVSQVCVY